MEFKTLALGAITGVSMTMTGLTPAIQPAMALGSHHPTITPIYCDECDEYSQSGGFSRIVSVPPHGLQIQFGETSIICPYTYVGARVDAKPGSTNWSVNMQTKGGHPFFVTEYQTASGPQFTLAVSSYSKVNGNITATFNGPALGVPNFTNLFIYDSGFNEGDLVSSDTNNGFTDTIDLTHGGILVNSFYPEANMVSALEDCTGIFSNGNSPG